MLQLARARVIRGDPTQISSKSTVQESFVLHGIDKSSFVCTSHDLIKSQVIVLHAQDHLDLMLQLDAAVPTCAWSQIDEGHGGSVLRKFGVRDYVMNKAASHGTATGKCNFAFVGVGNCVGNVWPEDVDKGIYPCTLQLQFIEAVPRGSAILMGSLHSVKSFVEVPYLTVRCRTPSASLPPHDVLTHTYTHQVAPSFGKGAASFALKDVPPGVQVGERELTSLEVLQKQEDFDKAIGDRFAGDFVTLDADGQAFATEAYNSRCVVCSTNELLPCEAHLKATGRKLQLQQKETREEEVLTSLSAFNGHAWLLAGESFEVDSYGEFRRDDSRQAYRWLMTKTCEAKYSTEVFSPWYDDNKDKWYAHRVRTISALPTEECEPLDLCRVNDGERVTVSFKDGSSYVVDNHIEDLGGCLKSWVVQHSMPALTKDEEMLDACLSTATLAPLSSSSPSTSPYSSSAVGSMSPVSMSWNTLMGSTSPGFSFFAPAAKASTLPPSLIADLEMMKLMLHTFE